MGIKTAGIDARLCDIGAAIQVTLINIILVGVHYGPYPDPRKKKNMEIGLPGVCFDLTSKWLYKL